MYTVWTVPNYKLMQMVSYGHKLKTDRPSSKMPLASLESRPKPPMSAVRKAVPIIYIYNIYIYNKKKKNKVNYICYICFKIYYIYNI